jgi:hypothetical protein
VAILILWFKGGDVYDDAFFQSTHTASIYLVPIHKKIYELKTPIHFQFLRLIEKKIHMSKTPY